MAKVLLVLIVNERFWLPAMVVGMPAAAHNCTELTRWTSTLTQLQLFSLLCSVSALHSCRSCRSTVHTNIIDLPIKSSLVFACATGKERKPSTPYGLTRTLLYRSSISCGQNSLIS